MQDEAIQKRTMVPLHLYRSSAASLYRSQWRVIDPGALSPLRMMAWGIRQLKGLVIGPDNPESLVRLQVLELVLVDNVKVCSVTCKCLNCFR
jgi:charged multivesicular body protein 7